MITCEKGKVVSDLVENFGQSQATFVVDYRGCTCRELYRLRQQLRSLGASLKVIKNTLARRAVSGTSFERVSDYLVGPTAVVWASNDAVAPAKVLKEFCKDREGKFQIKGGIVEGKVIDCAGVQELAELPSREEVLAKLLSVINAPAIQLLRTINAPASNMVGVLSAWKGKLDEGSSDPNQI